MVNEAIQMVLLNPVCLGLILFGVVIGIIFGAVPGLSSTMAMILFLPMSFGMEPMNGISLLIGLYLGGISGGLISAILLKIPGTASSIATVFDGGPMADKGKAGEALGVGILTSFVGGLICMLGQAITNFFAYKMEFGTQAASTATSICLIFLSALLTGLGVYDRIGKFAGAGSIVPITGFANSVVAPAMEFRREGLVMGVGAKLFTLAGPVLVYGIGSSVIVGLIAFFMEVM